MLLQTATRSARNSALLRNACALDLSRFSAGYATGAADRVVEVQDNKDFASKLSDASGPDSLMICDFTAKWCGPCRMIAPVFSKLSNQYPNVTFLKLDIDNEALNRTVEDHNITGVPTFVYYKGGRRVESFSGARADMLELLIKKHTK